MAMPTASDVHVDGLLTNISIGYVNKSYIADQVFGIVPVQRQSDIIPQYDKSHWFRNLAKLRAPATKSERSGYKVTNTAKYFCDRYSFGFEIPDDVRANADAPYNMDRDGVAFATDKIQMAREQKFATDFFVTTPWTTTVTGGTDFTQWSDYGASDPLGDMETNKETVEGLIADSPNVLVLGRQVWSKLKWHPDLIDTIKYTQRAQMTIDLAAALFELESILVGKALTTATAEGTAEGSVVYSRIFGKHGLLLYRPPSPGLMTPAAGYTFVWQRVPSAIQYIKRIRDEEREVDIIEANSFFDQKVTAADSGLFISGATA
ncbi:MAG: hypothetical protein PHE55_05135 [Methylococcaceae bacterium]|nr:hypothetical protein [Methylococcaceae bacterium]